MKPVQMKRLSALLKFVILVQMFLPADSITESMCFSTGFVQLKENMTPEAEPGSNETLPYEREWKDIGSNRIFFGNVASRGWINAFWALAIQPSNHPNLQISIRAIAQNKVEMKGWLLINLKFTSHKPFFVAIWAVNERNEVYGEFIPNTGMDVTARPSDFIPCSATPVNSDTVPFTYVYANLKFEFEREENRSFFRTITRKRSNGASDIKAVWRAPFQSFCNRPQKFRFVYVVTPPEKPWGDTDKIDRYDHLEYKAMRGSTVEKMGPIVQVSNWIQSVYFGSPTNVVEGEGTLMEVISNSSETWFKDTEPSPQLNQDKDWKYDGLFNEKNEFNPNQSEIVRRTTCRGRVPQLDTTTDKTFYNGRCQKPIDPKTEEIEFVKASEEFPIVCTDELSQFGEDQFVETHEEYMNSLQERLCAKCLCQVCDEQAGVAARSASAEIGRSGMLKRNSAKEDAEFEERDKTAMCLLINELSPEDQVKAGVCIDGNPGRSVYVNRISHGIGGLFITLVVTPISIFIARYAKGDIKLFQDRVPRRLWYSIHIFLIAPTLWMYAAGYVSIDKQVKTIGKSYTTYAKVHRIMGYTVYCLVPTHFITGCLRPKNICFRRIVIFIHWILGITQHALEVTLCITSCFIPGSPSSSRSNLSKKFFDLHHSIIPFHILGWVLFSTIFHIIMNVKIKIDDYRSQMSRRSIFPVIIPLYAEDNWEDIEMGIKDRHWFIIFTSLLYLLVSMMFYVVSLVALYHVFSEGIYHGFGPMSCTHKPNGELQTGSEHKCY